MSLNLVIINSDCNEYQKCFKNYMYDEGLRFRLAMFSKFCYYKIQYNIC